MIKFIKNKIVYINFCLILMIVNMFYINNIFLNNEKICNISFIIIAQVLAFIIELIFFRIIFKINKKISLENVFLLISLPLCIMYIIAIPMGDNPDEYAHFSRAYEITDGNLITKINENNDTGAEIPIEIVENSINFKSENYLEILNLIRKENSGKKTFHGFYNTALYNCTSYISILPGIYIGRILNFPIILTGYLGRISNSIFWIILIYFSIKYNPFLKEFILFISLIPVTISEASAITVDGFTFALSCFYISYILNLVYNKKCMLNLKSKMILFLISLIISLCKIIYFPLCFLILLIPNEKYKSKREKYITNIFIIAFSIIINLIWLKIASRYLIKLNPGVNSKEQLKFVLSNPFNFIQIIFNTISIYCEEYIFSFFGRNVAGTGSTSTIYIFSCIIIFINLISNLKDYIFEYRFKIIVFIILLTITGLMFSSLYLQWTPVKSKTIEGIQGRYFLPYIILVPLLFLKSNTENIKKYDINKNINLYICVIFSYNMYMLIEIFSKFI